MIAAAGAAFGLLWLAPWGAALGLLAGVVAGIAFTRLALRDPPDRHLEIGHLGRARMRTTSELLVEVEERIAAHDDAAGQMSLGHEPEPSGRVSLTGETPNGRVSVAREASAKLG